MNMTSKLEGIESQVTTAKQQVNAGPINNPAE